MLNWIDLTILALAILAVLLSWRGRDRIRAMCETALETRVEKERRKERALALLASKGEMSNAELRSELRVSSRSVVRYVDELEQEGKVEQIGETGRAVTYRLR